MTDAPGPPSLHRMKLVVHYDGAAFHGWQLQPDVRTVQGDLEAALERLTARPSRVLGSGRTDTGVHATGQVAAVDVPERWTAAELHRALGAVLPRDVWVASVEEVPDAFHPRYDAVARTYEYRIGTRPLARSPFHRRWCWPLAEPLELDALAAATDPLVGDHSFRAFQKSGQPERGERCVVVRADWSPWEIGVRLCITADRYLHHMVRYIVGTAVDVARGARPASDVPALLENRPGVVTSPPAPPEGLFLARVEYPSPDPPDPTDSRSRPPAS